MDLGNPASLISGLVIGLIGMVLFIYGKKEGNVKALAAGIALCVFPYFVASVILSWVLTGLCLGGLYLTRDGAM